MNRRLYAIHRWISAIAFLQLAIWVGSGFFFAVVPDRTLKGAPVGGAHSGALARDAPLVGPDVVLQKLQGFGAVERLELVGGVEGPTYRAKAGERRFRFDARTGEESPVSEAEAQRIARRDQPGAPAVRATERIESAPIEYRGRALPAWRVTLEDGAGTVVYVDAATGDVTARRNDVWRVYDFLWGLHLMDYRGRDTRNHPLLAITAAIAGATVFSGVILWALRFVRWVRGRRKARPDAGDARVVRSRAPSPPAR